MPPRMSFDRSQDLISALKEPTFNFVTFPEQHLTESIVEYVKKYAMPGAVGLGAAGMAPRDNQ